MQTSTPPQPVDAGLRKTPIGFLAAELAIYISQFMVFFFSAALISGLFRDEKRLVDYVNSKVTADSQFELMLTILSLVLVLGILFVIVNVLSGKAQGFTQSVAVEVLQEFPKVIYAVGSSIGGLAAAVGVFVALNPSTQAPRPGWWVLISAFIGLAFFMVGGAISFALKRKTHIATTP